MRKTGRLFAPAIVLTGNQTTGRGRGSNTWFSAAGSLTVTFALHSDVYEPWQLPLITGLAVRAACTEAAGKEGIKLKWPNDLLIDGRKLAGLLCQRVDKADLVGIGVNINTPLATAPRPLRRQITSLQQFAGREIDINQVLINIASHLRQLLRLRGEKPFAAFVRDYQHYDALRGQRIRILSENDQPGVKGVCHGIDDSGRLLVHDGQKMHRVIAGHVVFRDKN